MHEQHFKLLEHNSTLHYKATSTHCNSTTHITIRFKASQRAVQRSVVQHFLHYESLLYGQFLSLQKKKKKDFKMHTWTHFAHIMIKTGYRHSALISTIFPFLRDKLECCRSHWSWSFNDPREINVCSETPPDLKLRVWHYITLLSVQECTLSENSATDAHEARRNKTSWVLRSGLKQDKDSTDQEAEHEQKPGLSWLSCARRLWDR